MKRSILPILALSCAVAGWAGVAVAAGLPIYPGATRLVYSGPTIFVRCGHKISVVSYDSSANAESVASWYGDRIAGGIRVTHIAATGAGIAMTEIFEPDGVGVVAISPAHSGSGVHIGVGTYEPALSSAELRAMQAFMGSDSPAKQRAVAQMNAKCGPSSTR